MTTHDTHSGEVRTKSAAPHGTTLSFWSLLLAGGIVLALLLGQWTIVLAILGLALLITVHEFGHFLAAKAFGMRVERFYVGFPPAAAKRTWGETEYGIGIIPLGGFCKISGMTPDEPVADKTVDVLLAEAEGGHIAGRYTLAELDAAAKRSRAAAKAITDEGGGADDAELRTQRRLQVVLQQYRSELLAGEGDPVYSQKPIWQRNITIAAGPIMNIVAAVVILALFAGVQGTPAGYSLKVDTVEAHTPAAHLGLKPGDTLVGTAGARWATWAQAQAYLRAHPGQTITLVYRPAGAAPGAAGLRTRQVTLTHRPGSANVGFLGVAPGIVYRHPNPARAMWLGVTGTKDVVTGTFKGFWWLASGKISATGPNGAVGPVGIVNVSRQAVRQHWYPLLLAFLSVNLGIINLIPILPFDGGHIAINLLEKVRRRRLDTRVLERVVAAGTLLLVMLFIFLTFNDIRRIFGG